jgi:hypothetical protein
MHYCVELFGSHLVVPDSLLRALLWCAIGVPLGDWWCLSLSVKWVSSVRSEFVYVVLCCGCASCTVGVIGVPILFYLNTIHAIHALRKLMCSLVY